MHCILLKTRPISWIFPTNNIIFIYTKQKITISCKFSCKRISHDSSSENNFKRSFRVYGKLIKHCHVMKLLNHVIYANNAFCITPPSWLVSLISGATLQHVQSGIREWLKYTRKHDCELSKVINFMIQI